MQTFTLALLLNICDVYHFVYFFPMNVRQSLLQMYPIVQAGQKFMHASTP